MSSFITIDSARLRDMALAALENINAQYDSDMLALDKRYLKIKESFDAAMKESQKHWWRATPTYPDDLVDHKRQKGWNMKILETRREVPRRILVATSLVNEVNVSVKDLEIIKSWSDV